MISLLLPHHLHLRGELASLFTAPTREASEPITSISSLPVSNHPLQRLLLATGLGTGHQDSQPLGLALNDPSLHAREVRNRGKISSAVCKQLCRAIYNFAVQQHASSPSQLEIILAWSGNRVEGKQRVTKRSSCRTE